MKQVSIVVLAIAGLIFGQLAFATTTLTNKKDQVSYALGYEIGANLKHEKIDVDHQVFLKGLKNALSGTAGVMTEKQVQETLLNFQKDMLAKRAKQFNSLASKNKAEGDKFLAKNKAEQGIVTLPNGLQYKVLTAGTGQLPNDRDTVTVDYEGKTIGGKVFDSSYQRGKSTTFKVDEVIPAWSEALQKMKVGSTWMVYAPPSLAYGKTGIGGPIGPEQTLIFKIHLISVKGHVAGKPGVDNKAAAAVAKPNKG